MKQYSDKRAYRFINRALKKKRHHERFFKDFVITIYYNKTSSDDYAIEITFHKYYPNNLISKQYLSHRETGAAYIIIDCNDTIFRAIYALNNKAISKQNYMLVML